jgi:hypothetical protein
MPDVALHIREHLTGVGLVPAAVQVLGSGAELDGKIAGEVFGFDLAPFFLP